MSPFGAGIEQNFGECRGPLFVTRDDKISLLVIYTITAIFEIWWVSWELVHIKFSAIGHVPFSQ
jgi:hypothetical protein